LNDTVWFAASDPRMNVAVEALTLPEVLHGEFTVADSRLGPEGVNVTMTEARTFVRAAGPAMSDDVTSRPLPCLLIFVVPPVPVPPPDAAAMFGVATTTVTADADHAAPRSAVRRVMPLSFERD
jgi:hypothetical protein